MKKLLILLISLFGLNVSAAEGYKDMKFGSSIDEVRKRKLCLSMWEELDANNVWRCNQFKFAKQPIKAIIRFADQKLELINLVLVTHERDRVSQGLRQQYGEPTYISGNITLGQELPTDQKWFMVFDDDSIRLIFIPAAKVDTPQGQTSVPAQLNLHYQPKRANSLLDDL
ncbi:hypothetical protein HMPREF0027_0262 [Actinobacillus ureae ATCC 25976]|uniref:Uncharacterized protein n=1 Tax=Actinobacillus ureae ATCC 25976 TaxID=887324 RepID=E8KEJ5_9PAST|nr:hypothetical protein [Actinobacillus ureae]EFX92687.1 hypothetical protein HMPREF0027_0262 [Actinobacillus ureae ATCC 25976]